MTFMAATVCSNGPVVSLHRGFFTVVVVYAAVMALWGFFLFLRGSNPSGSYLASLILAEGVAILQGVVGLILLITGKRPDQTLHYVYGIVAVLILPSAYFFSRNGTERRDSAIFGAAAVLLVGIAIRAATTGCAS